MPAITPTPLRGAKQGDLKEIPGLAVSNAESVTFRLTGRESVFCLPDAPGLVMTIAGQPSSALARDEDHTYTSSSGDMLIVGVIPSDGFLDGATGDCQLDFSAAGTLWVIRH